MILLLLLHFTNYGEISDISRKMQFPLKTLNSRIFAMDQKSGQKSQFWRPKTLGYSNISALGREMDNFL